MEGTTVTIFGDTDGTLEGRAKGQMLVGVAGEINYLYGDAYLIENKNGGNDVLTGGGSSYENFLYGDGYEISNSQGGNDVLTGGTYTFTNRLHGDAFTMSDSRGGNDVLTGGANSSYNILFGDANKMSGSQGGNDALTGGANSSFNILYGEANKMSDGQGGNDVLVGGTNTFINQLYGDAFTMSDSQGGNDVLTGGTNSSFNILYGDAYDMYGSRGGNDTLIASDRSVYADYVTNNTLYGDAVYHRDGSFVCGNDRLISGTGNDTMWGDIKFSLTEGGLIDINLTRVTTGQDVFVFSANNGIDTIQDFRHGEDKIELNGVGVASFDVLMAESHLSQVNTNIVITFGVNTITVVGVTELTAADFLFT